MPGLYPQNLRQEEGSIPGLSPTSPAREREYAGPLPHISGESKGACRASPPHLQLTPPHLSPPSPADSPTSPCTCCPLINLYQYENSPTAWGSSGSYAQQFTLACNCTGHTPLVSHWRHLADQSHGSPRAFYAWVTVHGANRTLWWSCTVLKFYNQSKGWLHLSIHLGHSLVTDHQDFHGSLALAPFLVHERSKKQEGSYPRDPASILEWKLIMAAYSLKL